MTKHDASNRKHSSVVRIVLAAALIATGFGCGGEPTAPVSDTQPTATNYEVTTASPVVPVSAPVTGTVISRTQRVSALLGGTIVAGRHTLIIPPLALTRDTYITLRDVTGTMGRVECEALPEGLRFRLPATLITRFSDLTLVQGHSMYQIVNEGTPSEQWVPVGLQIKVLNLGISAGLQHFSRYAPGKNGW